MKKTLVIGSTVVDVIITLEDYLPKTQGDVHVLNQEMSLGGCAYNTSDMIRHFEVPYILFSPVGTGAYGDFVRTNLAQRKITTPIPTPEEDNGCCYCFIEKTGERTFISYHGAEYRFKPEWFDLLNPEEIDSVYICGFEIEETTGIHIVEWLEKHPELTVYFAPGPRLNKIQPALMQRLFALHPVIHLNEEESCSYHGFVDSPAYSKEGCMLEHAAAYLYSLTQNTVIVTLGSNGTYYHSADQCEYIASTPAHQIDTIGAGDSHIGAVIACRQRGMNLHDAILTANKAAAKVVETKGALLPDETFASLHLI